MTEERELVLNLSLLQVPKYIRSILNPFSTGTRLCVSHKRSSSPFSLIGTGAILCPCACIGHERSSQVIHIHISAVFVRTVE